nr:hypothetical protein [uncultured Lachnoclostridium sp.]
MKTVVFVSEKGGVGKTRLSDELYFYYTRQNVPVSLHSFDGQYKNRNNDKKVDNPTVAVVDTPGRIMDDKTIQTIQGADIVVIPTRPTGGNIESFTRTVSLVKENMDCPVIVAVNGVNRFTASVSFMEWLQKYRQKENLDVVLTIPQSEAIVQAENCRCSVNEINKYSNAAQAVNQMCDKISVLAGLPVEKRQPKSKKLIAK